MKGLKRRLAVFLGVAAVTFAGSLSVLWPRETQADDDETAAAVQEDVGIGTTKIGKLAATSRIVADERVKGKWYLEMTIKNHDLRDRQVAEVEGRVLALNPRSEAARVPSMPQVVFKCLDQIDVAAGETVVHRHELPAGLAKKLAAAPKRAGSNRVGQAVVRSSWSYQTSVAEVRKPPQKIRQATRS